MVTAIDRVDEEAKVVYFYATGTESTDNHFFRVGLGRKEPDSAYNRGWVHIM